jgi:phosphatidylethanolamine-binding protein (PEBP) family uncharacterized protein
MKKIISFVILTVSIGLLGCTKDSVAPTIANFTVLSSAFTDNGTLPIDYTCDGASASPPLSWTGTPLGTKSFAITMHHIPAPGERHEYMILYNISAATASIVKNVSGVGLFGINTVNGKTQYSPPCSQGPGAKLYVLTVYALSAEPVLSVAQTAVTMDVLLKAISATTLGKGVINVSYTRP